MFKMKNKRILVSSCLLLGMFCFQHVSAIKVPSEPSHANPFDDHKPAAPYGDGSTPPIANSVKISGTARVGQLQTGSYTYADLDGDQEGTSTFRWLRNDVAISGATSKTYTTVQADGGTTLTFEVTPVSTAAETPGTPVKSSGTVILNLAPVASSVAFSGTASVGQTQTGSYTYTDFDGDAEGTSTFRWLRDDVAISGATSQTYTTVQADVGTILKFEVTPVAATGTTSGTVVKSSGTTILNSTPTDITLSSGSIASNSPSGTTVGTLSATDVNTSDTFTFTLSTGSGCTATDNEKFTIAGTSLKIAEVTNFYKKNSYTACIQVVDQDGATYRENFRVLVPVPATVKVVSSVRGESALPNVSKIILDEEKTVDFSDATATVSREERDISVGGTTFDLETYTAGALNKVNVKKNSRINIGKATRINTSQENLVLTHTETSDVELQIPNQTVVFGESDADFSIIPPVNIDTTDVTSVPTNFTVKQAISVGSTTETYVFDTPVVVVFNNFYNGIVMRYTGASAWENVSQCAGDFASPTMPSFPNACWISDESLEMTRIYTFHLTDFGGLLENNGSGKGALFHKGMERSEIRQSGYGTDKNTFADEYEKSLTEVGTFNQGKSGIAEFIITTWNNSKFLRYMSGRVSVDDLRSSEPQQARYRVSNKQSDIQLVMQQRNKNVLLSSAPKKTSLQEKFEQIKHIFGTKKENVTPLQKTSFNNYFPRVEKIEEPLSNISLNQKERLEESQLRVKRPALKRVLRHLQNSLFSIVDFLETSLFKVLH